MVNILIVDDKEYIRKSYKTYLEDAGLGWNILTAKDENEAKEILLKTCPIEVIITDLVMLNEQSGIEVLRLAKERDPFVMVIIVTAFETKLDRYQAFEKGAFDCISKNVPGIQTGQEILVKTRTALQFRELTVSQIDNQKKIAFLRRYFDPRIFKMIEQNPELLAIRSQTVTIAFWDIRGFSALCESLKANPMLISGFLRDYFQTASEVIFANHGVLDKFIGDGVMALFGALNHKEDNGSKHDAVNAVNAALELKKRFGKLLKDWMRQWTLYTAQKVDIGLACGIHTGEVLTGNVGTETRDQFTALGPNVNFAQRVSSQAKKGQILVSTTTKTRIKETFRARKVATVDNVKNILGTFDLFEIIGASKSS